MKEFTEEYIKRLNELIDQKDGEAILEEVKDLHPADLAELVADLDADEAHFLIQLLDDETGADVISELDEDEREDVIKHIDDVEQAGDIVDLLQYDEDTAGGHMSTEMIVVKENMSMPDCIKAMREQAEDMDEIYNIYVVDDDEKLRGIFPLKKTITNPSASKIKHVMEPDPVSVKTDEHIEDVALIFEKYDLVALPVVDSINRLVGVITVDEVMDEVRESSERDYQLASGLSDDVESSDSIWHQVKARIPWLFIGIIGGIANALILDGDDGGGWQAVLPGMALFIPLIGGTGGNVGTQSSAIVVQGLANGSLELKNAGKHLIKEFGVALLNASIIAGLVLLYNFFFPADGNQTKAMLTAAAVCISLFGVVLFASIFGTLVPIVLEKLKIDPAIATGPFVTVTNDIIGMVIYMITADILIDMFLPGI